MKEVKIIVDLDVDKTMYVVVDIAKVIVEEKVILTHQITREQVKTHIS